MRIARKILWSLSLLALVSTALVAGEHRGGTVGMGWYSASAPIGARIWISPRIGVDLGVGFADKTSLGTSEGRLHFNFGVPIDIVQTERVNFFFRPGVEIQTNSRQVGTPAGPESKSSTFVTLDFGAEWYVTDQFSLSVGHGLSIEQSGSTDDWGVTALRALSFENVGFHFYFSR